MKVLLSSDPGSLDLLLQAATQIVTWLISTMTAFVTFVVTHPVVLMMFLVILISFAVGLLIRFMRNTGI